MRSAASIAVLTAIFTPIVKVTLDVCDLAVRWHGAALIAAICVGTAWSIAFRLDWRRTT